MSSHPWGKGTLPVRGEAPRAVVAAAHAAALRAVSSGGKKCGRNLPGGKAELRAARIASKRAARATSGADSFDPSLLLETLLAATLAQGVIREAGSGSEAGAAEGGSASPGEEGAAAEAEAGEVQVGEEAEAEEEEGEEEAEGEEEEEEEGEEIELRGASVVVRTERLSVVARSVALRLGGMLGWHGEEHGSGGRKSKRRVLFTLPGAARPASVDALCAARALCAKFAAELSGQALTDTVARLKDLRKGRHAKKAQEQARQGKVRFVAQDDSSEEEGGEEVGGGAPAAGGGGAAVAGAAGLGMAAAAAAPHPAMAGIAFVSAGSSSSAEEGGAAAPVDHGSTAAAAAAASAGAGAAPALAGGAAQPAAPAAEEGGVGAAAAAAAGPLEGLGEWEAHTRGFAAKMLLKMGFAGGALGKKGGSPAVLAYADVKGNKGKSGLGASAQ